MRGLTGVLVLLLLLPTLWLCACVCGVYTWGRREREKGVVVGREATARRAAFCVVKRRQPD